MLKKAHFVSFDELGRPLVPRFITPVRRSPALFGVGLVGGGNFELDLDSEDQSAFETSLRMPSQSNRTAGLPRSEIWAVTSPKIARNVERKCSYT